MKNRMCEKFKNLEEVEATIKIYEDDIVTTEAIGRSIIVRCNSKKFNSIFVLDKELQVLGYHMSDSLNDGIISKNLLMVTSKTISGRVNCALYDIEANKMLLRNAMEYSVGGYRVFHKINDASILINKDTYLTAYIFEENGEYIYAYSQNGNTIVYNKNLKRVRSGTRLRILSENKHIRVCSIQEGLLYANYDLISKHNGRVIYDTGGWKHKLYNVDEDISILVFWRLGSYHGVIFEKDKFYANLGMSEKDYEDVPQHDDYVNVSFTCKSDGTAILDEDYKEKYQEKLKCK